jgi:predicted secreted protein
MQTPLAIAVFFTIWWVALFAVLPLAARSRYEPEEAVRPRGVEPGAPIAPHLMRVAVWTTALAGAVFLLVDAFAFWMG